MGLGRDPLDPTFLRVQDEAVLSNTVPYLSHKADLAQDKMSPHILRQFLVRVKFAKMMFIDVGLHLFLGGRMFFHPSVVAKGGNVTI